MESAVSRDSATRPPKSSRCDSNCRAVFMRRKPEMNKGLLSPSRPRRSTALLAAGAALTVLGGTVALSPISATASSHREDPEIAGQPQHDNTDLYAFRSPDKQDTITFIANWIPFEEPAGGPNFYQFADDARHDINIDNDGDAKPDITYRWTFTTKTRNPNTFLYNTGPVTSLSDPDLNIQQTYKLEAVRNGRWRTLADNVPVTPSYVGRASMPDHAKLRQQAIADVGRGVKSFAGQADDPFFLDLRVFDLLYGGNLSEVGRDTLNGYNVNTVALQVPISHLVEHDPVIGVWTTTSRKDASGVYRQLSRLGMPLVNEVVIPVGQKDQFNASKPRNDAQFLNRVTDPELPKLIEAVYGIKAPATPRNDLVSVFLTGVKGLNQPKNVRPSEMLRLNTTTPVTPDPKRLGVLEGDNGGFPNGRRLGDDVVDIALQVVEGELVGSKNDLGDSVNKNDKEFGNAFPYVAIPHSGSRPDPGMTTRKQSGTTPLTGGKMSAQTPATPATPAAISSNRTSETVLQNDATTAALVIAGAGIVLLVTGTVVARRSRSTRAADS
jgi:hypothetical protein